MTTYLTPLPPAPQRTQPTTFADRADAWVTAIETVFTTEINTIITEVNSAVATTATVATDAASTALNAAAASIDADSAAASAAAASIDADSAAASAAAASIDADSAAASAASALISANNASAVSGSGNGQFSTIAVDINNGAIDGAVIGGAVPAAGSFTTVSASGTIRSDGTGARVAQVTTGGDSNYQLKHPAAGPVQFLNSGSDGYVWRNAGDTYNLASITSTGLSVTGGISATGAVSAFNTYGYGSVNWAYKIGSPSDGNGYISNVAGAVVFSSGGYYFGANSFQLDPSKTGMSNIQLNPDGSLDINRISVAPAGSVAAATTTATFDESGNLGLGVVPSAWGDWKAMDVGVVGGISNFVSQMYVTNNCYYDAVGWKYKTTGNTANYYQQNNGAHTWASAPSGTAGQPISFSQAMALDASGNLNITNLTASKAVFTDASKNLTTTGTLGVAQGGTGVATLTGLVKGNGTGAFSAATVRTDYAEPTTALATGILKNTTTTGAHTIAVAGTDYSVPVSITGMVKSSGTTQSLATAGTDYLAPGGALGTPSSGTLTNCTKDGTNGVGYLNIPQNGQSTAYTLVLADQGKHILHPSADTTARIFTIPANGTVAYPIGTAITFVNQNAAGVLTIAITTDTMRLAGAGTTGSRTLAANGVATAIKLTATEWIISGTNLS